MLCLLHCKQRCLSVPGQTQPSAERQTHSLQLLKWFISLSILSSPISSCISYFLGHFCNMCWDLCNLYKNRTEKQPKKKKLLSPLSPPSTTLFILCKSAKSLQSCLTVCDPMDCSPSGSSAQGILQERILKWVALSSSKGPLILTHQNGVHAHAPSYLTILLSWFHSN